MFDLCLSVHESIVFTSRPYDKQAAAKVSADLWRTDAAGVSPDKFLHFLEAGHAWVPCQLEKGERRKSAFARSNVFALDFDAGMSLEQAEAEFHDTAWLIYTTLNHQQPKGDQPPCDRFRVVFVVDRPIYEVETWQAVMDGLLSQYPQADQSCRDPSRMFYACTGALIHIYDGVYHPVEYQPRKKAAPKPKPKINDVLVREVRSLLWFLPEHIENDEWIRCAFAAHQTVGDEAAALITERWPDNTRALDFTQRDDGCNLATLYFVARKYGYGSQTRDEVLYDEDAFFEEIKTGAL